jgi:ribulose-5-phosphate 4-epimerase/fuculose-1-phosphate aldolase
LAIDYIRRVKKSFAQSSAIRARFFSSTDEVKMSEIIVDLDEARRDLAAVFRWIARESMHEGIANHFSFAVSDDGQQFLMNPYGVHFSRMKASDLVLLDARKTPDDYGENIDPTAWWIHGAMHRNNPQARCIIHLHSKYATALSALKDPSLPAVDQTTCRFHNRVAIDTGFDGMGLDDEAERLSHCLGNKRMMMMGNHGFMSVGETPALAFDLAYHYERGCRTYVTALSTGAPLSFLPDNVAEKTARQWEQYENAADKHLAAIRSILDDDAPDYLH